MVRRPMSDRQFQILYDRYLPGLYKAALFLTGDQAFAERAAAQAFLKTAVHPEYAADHRVFPVEAARLLYHFCNQAVLDTYKLPKGFERLDLPISPAQMTLPQRAVTIFAIMGYAEAELPYLVGVSRATVRRYLYRFVPGMCVTNHTAIKILGFLF